MGIPVSGYMYHLDDSDPYHSHRLYITSWDGKPIHTHNFSGVTSYDVGHNHKYVGRTEPAASGVQHTHRYFTFTSIDDGHEHIIQGVTGPAIFLPNGGHIHEFNGMTTVDGQTPHYHRYSGKTNF
ncbi:YmaF family protein [Bacillus sp. Marseille-P3661]|uniref:YmaF family protein n=1 Tax=Bacillus sp. Marseille-P3661 TaxID=1936234 RepID=UPI000C855209|nr:YmaF family protein [Bacillus sp. Marseille-P3661]